MSRDGLPSRIAVVGLGYVGFPLAAAFGRLISTVGFDVNSDRIRELQEGYDRNGELNREEMSVSHLELTDDPACLRQAPFIIVAVPTPVDKTKRPDLSYLVEASRLVGQYLSPGAIIVYESTVYPGCTEEVCIPLLERESGLKAGRDFHVGYSPERMNPGDPEYTLEKVVKVVSAQDPQALEVVAGVYGRVVKAGVYRASDIRTAEAAKVIENVQRDLNIALMNELAMLFHRMGLNTREVLAAAQTKWNFLPFEPGLVGGHCIPVDPYYLTHRAQEVGYHPEVILAGRRINDAMGIYVAQQTVKLLIQAGKAIQGTEVLVLGVAFKENVRDVRNSRVIDIVQEMESYGSVVSVYEPLVVPEALERLGLRVGEDPFTSDRRYDAVVLAVPHKHLREKELDAYLALLKKEGGPGVFVDVKGALPWETRGAPDVLYWRL